jgi:protein TonB
MVATSISPTQSTSLMSLLPTFFPASLDDLVFEGRNQAYGAYQLRQAYNGHVRTALSLMIGLCALLAVGGTAWQRMHPAATPVTTTSTLAKPMTPPTYVAEAPKPKPIAPPAQPAQPRLATTTAAVPRTAATLPTEVAKDELVPTKPDVKLDIPEPAPGLATTSPAVLGTDDVAGSATGTTTGKAGPGSEGGTGEGAAVTGPYIVVEKMPEFAGGMDALMRYLRSHLRYPSAALREQAEGRVYVSFVVQADGTIADISVPKGLGYGLDEEAQRVVRQMPPWTPGRQSNHAVPVRFTLPITFKIQ